MAQPQIGVFVFIFKVFANNYTILSTELYSKELDSSLNFSYHSSDSSNVQIAYSLDWQDPWEPFYIAPNHVPLYDERFKQVTIYKVLHIHVWKLASPQNVVSFKQKLGSHLSLT